MSIKKCFALSHILPCGLDSNMAVLLLYPRRSPTTIWLEQEAQSLGWDTLRLEKPELPENFQLNDRPCALFYTPPGCFTVAKQLSKRLVACHASWLPELPQKYLSRVVRRMELSKALAEEKPYFYKPALNKYFEAGVRDGQQLTLCTPGFPPSFEVLQSEVVEWTVEYRCFVLNRQVVTHAPYKRHGKTTRGQGDFMGAPEGEIVAARNFAQTVVNDPEIDCPPAFVLDVGLIQDRDWAVIEPNECWASSIYGCQADKVLQTLLGSTFSISEAHNSPWDYQNVYYAGMNQKQ